MIKPTRRPWFRLHPLTLIAAVIAAGMLLGTNLTAERGKMEVNGSISGESYGWPLKYVHRSSLGEFVEPDRGFFNLAVNISILVLIWFCFERLQFNRKHHE